MEDPINYMQKGPFVMFSNISRRRSEFYILYHLSYLIIFCKNVGEFQYASMLLKSRTKFRFSVLPRCMTLLSHSKGFGPGCKLGFIKRSITYYILWITFRHSGEQVKKCISFCNRKRNNNNNNNYIEIV